MSYRISTLMVVLFIISVFSYSTVTAGNRAKGLIITPYAGGYVFEGNEPYKAGPLYGLGVGYRFNKYWSAELSLSFADLDIDNCNEQNSDCEDQFIGGYDAYIDVTYDILPQYEIVPFITLGMGAMALDFNEDADEVQIYDIHNKTRSVFHYGAGVRYALSNHIDIRADVRHALTFDISEKEDQDYDLFNNLMATLGFTYAFGHSTPTIQHQPQKLTSNDYDQDGVPDSIDKCPNTVPGISVNALGCPHDSDEDGVYDYQDQCPGTVPGGPVDMFGCSKDSDSDGIVDANDKCPQTPANVAVGSDGCPLDSDMDGVNDDIDKCPYTRAGEMVDATGCKKQQKNKTIHLKLKIEFESSKAEIAANTLDKVKEVADVMGQYPGSTAVIEAHTDSSGGADYNLKLSQRRANMVVYYLSNFFGIDRSRLRAIGYGEARPIADNRTKAGRKKNRRAVAIITATQ